MLMQRPPRVWLQIASECLHQLLRREEHGQTETYDPSALQTEVSGNRHNCKRNGLHRQI